MKNIYLLITLTALLSACAKEQMKKEDPLAWKKNFGVLEIDGKKASVLLECRSLKDENHHLYASFYIPNPEQYKTYTQTTNNDGDTVTNFQEAMFSYSSFIRGDGQETYTGKYLTKVSIVITKKLNETYYYDIVATSDTVEYFSRNFASPLNKISQGDVLIKILRTENNFRVVGSHESLSLEKSFECRF